MLIPPPNTSPLEYKGIRYEQDRDTRFEGRELAATYLSATSINSNQQLWIIKIRSCIRFPPGAPTDIACVDISKIALGPSENELTIETIVDSQYVIDLQTQAVTLVPRPEPIQKRRRIETPDPSDPPMPPPRSCNRKSKK